MCVCANWQSTSPLVFYLHDAVYLYTRALNKTIADGGDYRNGTVLVRNSIGQQFTGTVRIITSSCMAATHLGEKVEL